VSHQHPTVFGLLWCLYRMLKYHSSKKWIYILNLRRNDLKVTWTKYYFDSLSPTKPSILQGIWANWVGSEANWAGFHHSSYGNTWNSWTDTFNT
jgi:hypothetical protein